MVRSVLLTASTALIAATALAPAAGATVLGPATGVTAVRTGANVDVTFTPGALATSRLKAGRSVSLSCYLKPATSSLQLKQSDTRNSDFDLTWADGKVGADGVAHLKLLGNPSDDQPGPADYCEVARVRHLSAHSTVTNTVARVPLTPAGATYVDETEHATALRRLLQKAHAAAGYQPVAALGAGVVAMDAPDATPPAGQIGYWTDGAHAAVATLSAAGRRLLIQDLGNDVLRSNVYDEMDPLGFDDVDPSQLPKDASGTGPKTEPKSPDADRKPSPYKATSR